MATREIRAASDVMTTPKSMAWGRANRSPPAGLKSMAWAYIDGQRRPAGWGKSIGRWMQRPSGCQLCIFYCLGK